MRSKPRLSSIFWRSGVIKVISALKKDEVVLLRPFPHLKKRPSNVIAVISALKFWLLTEKYWEFRRCRVTVSARETEGQTKNSNYSQTVNDKTADDNSFC